MVKKKKKKENSGEVVKTSCGSGQISAAAGVIAAPRVGCIDEEIHSAERLEKLKENKKKESRPGFKSK